LIETDFPYQVKWTTSEDYTAALRAGYATAASWRGITTEQFIQKVYDNGTVFTNRVVDR
jgi:Tat protein secretion system quality control protein TatD with DNase activity